MSRRAIHNRFPATELPPDAPRDAVKVEFSRRLQERMNAKGMRQSDLARRAAESLPKGVTIGRDSVSLYIRGRSLPGPVFLEALAKALGCKPEDLVPVRGLPSSADASPSFDMKETSDGNVWLRVNQAVPWQVALDVAALLKGKP